MDWLGCLLVRFVGCLRVVCDLRLRLVGVLVNSVVCVVVFVVFGVAAMNCVWYLFG